MKHRSRVEQFGIEPQPHTLARQGAPMINAARMVKKERGFRVPHQLGYFTSNLAIGDGNLVYCGHHWVFSSRSWGGNLVMLNSPAAPERWFRKAKRLQLSGWRKSLVLVGNAKFQLSWLKLKLLANEGWLEHILV
jgi:hypothetical protein